MSGKNAWLLGNGDPPPRQPSINEIISLLEAELAKGEAIYTPAELKKLATKLSEYRDHLRVLTQGG
ncbi:MAG: hypothetical protein GJT30_09715 [Geobacter sp.]|nr:hypothetical protein [Geobacter sp.]